MKEKSSLKVLFDSLSNKRRFQIVAVFFLSLLAAAAEIITVATVIPFLSLFFGSAAGQGCSALFGLCQLSPQQITAGLVVAVLSAVVLRLLIVWAGTRLAYSIGADLGMNLYDRVLRQPFVFHTKSNSSQIISGVNKANYLVSGVVMPMMQGSIALVLTTAIFIVLISIDTWTSITALTAVASFYAVVSLFTRIILKKNSRIIARCETQRIQSLQEGLGGIRDILLDNTQDVYVSRFAKVIWRQKRAQAANVFIRMMPRYVIEGIGLTVVILVVGLMHEQGGAADVIPTLGALALGAQRLLPQLQVIYSAWSSLSANTGVIDDIKEFLLLPVGHRLPGEMTRPHDQVAREHLIEMDDVSFSYDGSDALVLKNVNLRIPKGSKVGFVGKTGSGKSTLLDIIMGLLTPSKGTVLVDGEALQGKGVLAWQRRIAHVPQSVFLSDASIAENVAFGRAAGEFAIADVETACQKAQVASYIDGLEQRYDTFVGERGVRLSGGQRQRIGLARALYKNADVLVLDEATSALDDATEASVMAAIRELGDDVTVLMIAHRLSTLKSCDFVVRLEGGSLVEIGTYEEIVGQS